MNDPKFSWVARKADCNVATVVAVWAALLEHASQAEPRGSVETFDCEAYDCALGLDDGVCARVTSAMREKGLVASESLAKWDERQPKREREDDSSNRVRKHRENKRNATVTPCNALEEIREDKKEEELCPAADGVTDVFDHWKSEHNHPKAKLDEKRRKLIRNALKNYSADDLKRCISGYKNSPHHMGQNDRQTVYDDIENFLRDAKHVDAGLKFAGATRWQ